MLVGVAVLAGAAVANVQAQLNPHERLTLGTQSRIWINGTSNVRLFECTAAGVGATVSGDLQDSPNDVVESASIVVPVAKLDCGNETMNEHMRKALKAEGNPQILWKMTAYEIQGTNLAIHGKLTIAGKEKAIDLRGTGAVEKGTLHVKGARAINMKEFGVKPPSLFLGTMKVADQVTVSFDLVLNQ